VYDVYTGIGITNILTIDVEDWYMNTDISMWDSYEDRIVESTNKILRLLTESNTKATFFVLGYVAENYPKLVEEIKDEGHEIATHGYSHTMVTKQRPSEFKEDLLKSVRILETITGDKVMGYRAPWFTIMEGTAWAIDVLKKEGLRYDSSVFPIKTHRYGLPDAPLFPFHISSTDIKKEDPKDDFLEFPLSVYKLPIVHKNIPVAGGFYLRSFPYWFIKHAIRKINKMGHFPYWFIKHAIRKINKMGQPAVFYIHPWELDLDQPRIKELEWHHYYNLPYTERKFKRLLNDFAFTSVRAYKTGMNFKNLID
jgi:polysaccharide deacetylase family protein (PEP-CTERM system associated)